jgi:hypothetical protein
LIDRGTDIQTQIGCNLLITAATAVQLVSGFADDRDELLFDEVMNIFRFGVFEKCGRYRGTLADLFQPLQNADELICGENPSILQRARMRAAGRKFVAEQSPVEAEGPLPALEFRIQRLPEPSRPHLHCFTPIA